MPLADHTVRRIDGMFNVELPGALGRFRRRRRRRRHPGRDYEPGDYARRRPGGQAGEHARLLRDDRSPALLDPVTGHANASSNTVAGLGDLTGDGHAEVVATKARVMLEEVPGAWRPSSVGRRMQTATFVPSNIGAVTSTGSGTEAPSLAERSETQASQHAVQSTRIVDSRGPYATWCLAHLDSDEKRIIVAVGSGGDEYRLLG